MTAQHTADDEIKLDVLGIPEPTPEYYGICGVCHGSGEIPDVDRPNYQEPCYNCGGDGKSELKND